MKHIILVTGLPRIGKTTVLLRTAEKLSSMGYKVGGMTSREVLKGGFRVGFEVEDYVSGEKGWLAHSHLSVGPRIGKYRVNLQDLDLIGVTAILRAFKDADIVLIDEIGPMELLSENFRDAVIKVVNGAKPMFGTVHYRTQDQLVTRLKARKDSEIVVVTVENRTQLPTNILTKFLGLNI